MIFIFFMLFILYATGFIHFFRRGIRIAITDFSSGYCAGYKTFKDERINRVDYLPVTFAAIFWPITLVIVGINQVVMGVEKTIRLDTKKERE